MVKKTERDYTEEIRTDPIYVELKEIVKTIKATIRVPTLMRECTSLHEGRDSPKLWKINMAPVPIYEAATKDMSARSRLTTIRVSTYNQAQILDVAIKRTRKHLNTTYREFLAMHGSTIADRNSMCDKIMNSAITLNSELDTLCNAIDLYVKDIDQSSFGIRNVVELLKVMIERPGQVV